jgi:hypothetical protein
MPLVLPVHADFDQGEKPQGQQISYSKDIVPILGKYCLTCHVAEEEHPSELFMDSYETLLKGGRHGKAVVPGNAKESLMYRKLLPNPPFGRIMPPSKTLKPSAGQIDTIRAWIEQGAKKN